jgi:signal transduction histidine kinase
MMNDQHHLGAEKLARFAHWLLDPLPHVTDPGQRRQARLLASFQLATIVLLIFNIARGMLVRVGGSTYSLVGQLTAILILYAIARAGHIRASSILTVITFMAIPYATLFENPGYLPGNTLAWFALPVVLAGALLPWYATLIVGAAAAASIVVYINLIPSVAFDDVGSTFFLIINLTILIVIFTNHRDRLEGARQVELRQTNKQLKHQADLLQVALARADEVNRLKSEFLATMSHELRTPLNAVIGYTELMLGGMAGQIDGESRQMLERIQSNSSRLLRLINNILDLATIEARRIDLIEKPFSPRAMINSLTEEIRNLAQQKPLGYEVHIDPDLPSVLIGDQGHLEQVVSNLLSNAFKFTEKGHVRLSVDRRDKDWWTITVSDTGIGIPADAFELIFEPFRQVDGSPQRPYQGSGLGLAIVDELVRAMRGTVKVESTLGRGSAFIVALPMVKATPQQMEGTPAG